MTKAEKLKLRRELAREAEKKGRVEPIPDCPDFLARFVGLIPEEVLEEFGADEYVNHMRDELQNARLKGKSKYKVILKRLLEFTLYTGKRQLFRLKFRRRTSIK